MDGRDLEELPPARIIRFATIDSTSSEAFRRAAAGEAGNLWIVAGRQLTGRGRRNRSWTSEPGNLFCSVLLRPPVPVAVAGQLSFVAALALHDAITATAPALRPKLALKWPNDLLVAGRKLSGILLESSAPAGGPLDALVIGFGINCSSHPQSADYPATNLAAEGAPVSPDDLLSALIAALSANYSAWAEGEGFADVRSAWLARASGLGEEITVRLPNSEIRGTFESVDPDGALTLRSADGSLRRIAAGEVFLGSTAAAGGHAGRGIL